MKSETRNLPIKKLEVDPANVRRNLALTPEFTASVVDDGMIEPLVVRPRSGGKFGVVVGARRFAAAESAGLKTLPCTIRYDLENDMDAEAVSFKENVHREDIPGWRLREIIEKFYEATDRRRNRENRINEVCDRLNVSRRTAQRYLIISDLPEAFIMRLKKPAQRSESEKKQLERMRSSASKEKPVIDERSEEIAPTELDVTEPIPVEVAEVCARDESFVKLAKKKPGRAHLVATAASRAGRKTAKEVVDAEKQLELAALPKPPPAIEKKPRPQAIAVTLGDDIMKALKKYASDEEITDLRILIGGIVAEFLEKRGYLEP